MPISELKGRIVSKLWIPIEEVESVALDQIRAVASLEWVRHIAIMPDCLTDDSEVLTPTGWKRILETRKGDSIISYDMSTGKALIEKCSGVIIRPRKSGEKVFGFSFPFSNSNSRTIRMSENHRLALSSKVETKASDILDKSASIKDFVWHSQDMDGLEAGSSGFFDVNDFRFLAWVLGDGSIKKTFNERSTNFRIRFGFKKKRKIDRLLSLLSSLGITPYVSRSEKQTEIVINTGDSRKYLEFLSYEKIPPWNMMRAGREKIEAFLHEFIHVDGDYEAFVRHKTIRYNTCSKGFADFLSALSCCYLGATSIWEGVADASYKKGTVRYIVSVITPDKISRNPSGLGSRRVAIREDDYDRDLVCLSCPSTYFFARQGGSVFVTGNCHAGVGATIGSVIGMEGAVSPSAVGVDIGCLDKDTEFLSPSGWKRISDWNGEEVLQFSPISQEALFVPPLAFIKKEEPFFYHLKHRKGLDQMVCPNHRILFYRGYKRESRRYDILIAEDFVAHHKTLRKGIAGGFLTTFNFRTGEVSLNSSEIRVHLMVSADGCIREGGGCEVHLKKARKIARAKKLLEESGIDYKIYNHKDETVTYYFRPPLPTKSLDILYSCSTDVLKDVIPEVFYWDGHRAADGQEIFSSSDKAKADAVQFALAAVGIRAGIHRVDYQKEGWEPTFQVYTTKNIFVNMGPDTESPVEKVPSPDGFSYCFSVPSGFFVARRNNNIFITGNCGVDGWKTSLFEDDLPVLAALREDIEKAIPTGFNQYDTPRSYNPDVRQLFREYGSLSAEVKDLEGKAKRQMGTLGGGNHFIEICLDLDKRVWFLIHSGSRNIGKCLADIHIARAKTLDHNKHLVSRALSVLLENTPEMDAYERDLDWALRYARLNRLTMMRSLETVFRKNFSKTKLEILEKISCHHNFASKESHFGSDLWVTRKGAIQARAGELAIIPGSMGTRSYIVRGLGNPESLESASHGAGRKMSRSAAKKKFSLGDAQKQTAGVECRKDRGILDELPGAYKDVDQVMEYQGDLVEKVAQLRAVLCVKG